VAVGFFGGWHGKSFFKGTKNGNVFGRKADCSGHESSEGSISPAFSTIDLARNNAAKSDVPGVQMLLESSTSA